MLSNRTILQQPQSRKGADGAYLSVSRRTLAQPARSDEDSRRRELSSAAVELDPARVALLDYADFVLDQEAKYCQQ